MHLNFEALIRKILNIFLIKASNLKAINALIWGLPLVRTARTIYIVNCQVGALSGQYQGTGPGGSRSVWAPLMCTLDPSSTIHGPQFPPVTWAPIFHNSIQRLSSFGWVQTPTEFDGNQGPWWFYGFEWSPRRASLGVSHGWNCENASHLGFFPH